MANSLPPITTFQMLVIECAGLVNTLEQQKENSNTPMNKSTNVYVNIPKSLNPAFMDKSLDRLKTAWTCLYPQAQTTEELKTFLVVWNTLELIKNCIENLKHPPNSFVTIPLDTPKTVPTLPSFDESLSKWAETKKEIFFDQKGTAPLLHFLSMDYPSTFLLSRTTYKSAQEAFTATCTGKKNFDAIADMEKILEAKFAQNTDLKKMLLATKDLPLYFREEGQGKKFWGVDAQMNGQNMLGILLVNLRKTLKN